MKKAFAIAGYEESTLEQRFGGRIDAQVRARDAQVRGSSQTLKSMGLTWRSERGSSAPADSSEALRVSASNTLTLSLAKPGFRPYLLLIFQREHEEHTWRQPSNR